jgi:hypothetical protein
MKLQYENGIHQNLFFMGRYIIKRTVIMGWKVRGLWGFFIRRNRRTNGQSMTIPKIQKIPPKNAVKILDYDNRISRLVP